MSNEHVVRRAGQRLNWYGRSWTLTDQLNDGTWDARCDDASEGNFSLQMLAMLDGGDVRCRWLSDVAPTSAVPPAGYKRCRSECGRWTKVTWPEGNPDPVCFTCHGTPSRMHPDWTPPLESKPAETFDIAKQVAVENGMRFVPPAPKAPKAPKCGSCVKTHSTVLERVRKGGRMLLCEPCMLAAEAAQGDYPSEGRRLRDMPERQCYAWHLDNGWGVVHVGLRRHQEWAYAAFWRSWSGGRR